MVISDFIMPQMRGDELLVRLHARYPSMIKVMLTGQADFAGVRRVINEASLYRFIDGRIDLHSEVGVGTTFTVWLPLHQPEG
jgi:DNA-binding NtrC family response regulator